jgi:hypothetical protein
LQLWLFCSGLWKLKSFRDSSEASADRRKKIRWQLCNWLISVFRYFYTRNGNDCFVKFCRNSSRFWSDTLCGRVVIFRTRINTLGVLGDVLKDVQDCFGIKLRSYSYGAECGLVQSLIWTVSYGAVMCQNLCSFMGDVCSELWNDVSSLRLQLWVWSS